VWYNDGNSTQWVVANNTQIQVGVSSFNARQGAVTLTPADVRAASAGVTDGSNAAAGQIGEFLINNTASSSPVNSVSTVLVGLGLSAGDWDVWGHAGLTNSTSLSYFAVCINNVPNTLSGAVGAISLTSATINISTSMVAPMQRINVGPGGGTAYLNCQVNYSSGTPTLASYIYARRVR
jgi:hypothetical protein